MHDAGGQPVTAPMEIECIASPISWFVSLFACLFDSTGHGFASCLTDNRIRYVSKHFFCVVRRPNEWNQFRHEWTLVEQSRITRTLCRNGIYHYLVGCHLFMRVRRTIGCVCCAMVCMCTCACVAYDIVSPWLGNGMRATYVILRMSIMLLMLSAFMLLV